MELSDREKGMLTVQGTDAHAVKTMLEQGREHGNRYIVLDMGKPVLQPYESYRFFETKEQAEQAGGFLQQRSGQPLVLPVVALEDRLSWDMKRHQEQHPDQGMPAAFTLDAGMIATQERQRLEIFKEHFGQTLKDLGYQPAVVENVRQQIDKDLPRIEVEGMRVVQGKEEPYKIRIEQNKDLAFEIREQQPLEREQKSIETGRQQEVLGGTIKQEDAPEIKQLLQEQKEAGNRFVAFESGQFLTKDHLIPFKSSFSAMEYAYENTTDYDRFIVRSIAVIEKEVDKILENKKEQSKEQQPGKLPQHDREEKRPRGQELSR